MKYCVSSKQGRRYHMYPRSQDSSSYNFRKINGRKIHLFGVYDGHGKDGHFISQEIADNLPGLILSSLELGLKKEEIIETILHTFDKFIQTVFNDPRYIESGSTVTLALVYENKIYFINCGDSFSFWNSISGTTHQTEFHDCSNVREINRLKQMNIPIYFDRINGNISVTRSFGDFEFQKLIENESSWVVSPIPDIYVASLSKTKYFFLASDGLIENNSLSEIVSKLDDGISLNKLVEECSRTSTDDITILKVIVN